MVKAHQQAWIWQDEWFGMTMADIRKLEKETQEILAKKMANTREGTSEEKAQGKAGSEENDSDQDEFCDAVETKEQV